jgi:hypothetical protein
MLTIPGSSNPIFSVFLMIPIGFLGLGACAIHPVPEDVTGVKTTHIVHRIRCEAQDIIRQAETRFTRKKKLDKLKTLKSIGIVYSFSLSGTETDSLMASATVTKPLTHGMWSYNPSLGDSLTRQNVRVFTIVDNYKTLIEMKKCDEEPAPMPNYQYPIVGSIGIKEMIRTFIHLALNEDLDEEEGSEVTSLDTTAKGPPTMADTISFTTTITAGVSPTIMLTPVTAAAHLASGSLSGSVGRTDVHQVIVGLAVPDPKSSGNASSTPAAKKQTNTARARFGLLISAPSSLNDVEEAAVEAVNTQILRFEVPRPLITTN